jgi:hypothetical protein
LTKALPDGIINTESEGNAMENKWTLIDSQQVGGIWYDDYTNEDGTLCRRVWMDGEEEIWPITKINKEKP